jgi:hypothetical protein
VALRCNRWSLSLPLHREIESVDEDALSTYDVIVNCTGLGSMKLFGDTTMMPTRGHLMHVRAGAACCHRR